MFLTIQPEENDLYLELGLSFLRYTLWVDKNLRDAFAMSHVCLQHQKCLWSIMNTTKDSYLQCLCNVLNSEAFGQLQSHQNLLVTVWASWDVLAEGDGYGSRIPK